MPFKDKQKQKEYSRQYKIKNRAKINAQTLASYHKNKVLKPIIRLSQDQLKKNKQLQDKRYRENNRQKIKEMKRNYYLKNREKINIYRNKQYKENTEHKLRMNLRSRLNSALKGQFKAGSAVKNLGCSIKEFKIYIESKFQPGMTWGNHTYSGWHLDHIIPLCKFNLCNKEEFLKACHYTNIQPLWAKENQAKNRTLYDRNN